MFDPIKYGYVNWADGMKISQAHFHQLQSAIEARVKDSRATGLRNDNFGLIPSGANAKNALDFDFRVDDTANLKIKVRQCRAISPAGDRIEIIANSSNSSHQNFEKTVKLDKAILETNGDFYITLRANSDEPHLYGEPDQEESPARMPYFERALDVEIVQVNGVNKNVFKNSAVIARFSVENGEITEDVNYIPPCAAMASHRDLSEFAFKYAQFLGDLETDLFKINKNVSSKDQLTNLAQSVADLTRNVIQSIQQEIDFIRMFSEYSTPSLFMLNAKKIARAFKNAIELNSNDKKEELLNYVQEVIDISPGEYTAINARVLDLEYDHYNVRDALQVILQFCKINGKLISEWGNLDYIGKKKKTGIFVGEVKKDTEVTKERKKWDF
ncbi:hypothetical protein G3O08_08690 [Cryomorpha ignava]|uniref:Type VI secretion system baseplate subunit TssK n=1 Tax=Cryomorpha ignava TaxID=101383 RepID=A0A7K3WPV1_9FLAO|nr:hypothetical protein [Cryomorpha ignava]NEN23576.1 hypothetical protein [Cryomorpha ignava]